LEGYARLWKKCVNARLRQKGATNIIDIRYEDLCADPVTTMTSAMAFLGEKLDPEQLKPSVYGRTSIKQKAGHQRLADPISSQSVGEWRTKLSAAELRRFTVLAGRELRLMGYQT
jgi:hypothetical protein